MFPIAAFPHKSPRVPVVWEIVPLYDMDAIKVEAASGNLTLVEPPGTKEGDIILAAIDYRDTPAFTLPANWTLVGTQQSSGNVVVNGTTSIGSLVVAAIIRGASAPSFAFLRTGGDVALGACISYRGQAGLPHTASSNTLGSASVTATTGTITTDQADSLLVAFIGGGRNAGISGWVAATGATTPAGTTDATDPASNTWKARGNPGTNTGADGRLGIADAIMTTAGATGTVQATVTSHRPAMIVCAIRKAA